MKKVLHIVGNRPQFIKLAPVVREFDANGIKNIIIHTGQHYDDNMSAVFFKELHIPNPDVNLHISGKTHAQMTGDMMKSLEDTLVRYEPELVIVYGDTNSTIAAALTAKKLGVITAHIEAGVRTGNDNNPEEINRKATDHIVDFLFAPDKKSLENLNREGLADRSVFSGDVMYDAFRYYQNISSEEIDLPSDIPNEFVLLTWHRQENTNDKDRMIDIIELIKKIPENIVCPLHPRTRKMLNLFGLWGEIGAIPNLRIIDPVGYLEVMALLNCTKWVVTDSGGLSKESYFAKKKCISLLDFTVWPELEEDKWIIHTEKDIDQLLKKVRSKDEEVPDKWYFGDGNASKVIVNYLVEHT